MNVTGHVAVTSAEHFLLVIPEGSISLPRVVFYQWFGETNNTLSSLLGIPRLDGRLNVQRR